jgi:glycogen operon protein
MDEAAWANGYARAVMVFLNGQTIPEPDTRGQKIVDDHFLVLFNGSDGDIEFTIPTADYGDSWVVEIDTAVDAVAEPGQQAPTAYEPGAKVTAIGRSVVVLRCARS